VKARDRVLEVGAGLGSLTVALAATGARVTAIEFDRALIPALEEVLEPLRNVRLEVGDAMRVDWDSLLGGDGWKMVSNLPYNLSVPLVADLLAGAPSIGSYLVMVQREVGERLAAGAGEEGYGAVSLRVAFRARAELVRRVPASVFWPEPNVESVLVRLSPRPAPVDADEGALFRVVEEGFAERRKTMTNALKRIGLDASSAVRFLKAAEIDPLARAEQLDLADFARITTVLVREAALP
jgi:16S rRNA (adenine1518-N6/adenine1519-N6)-dimethyltransferase